MLPRRASTLNNAVRVRARVRAEADFGDPFAPAIDVPGARGQLKRNRSSEQLHDRDRLSQRMQFLREKNHAGLFGATEAAAACGGAGIHDSAYDDGLGFTQVGTISRARRPWIAVPFSASCAILMSGCASIWWL